MYKYIATEESVDVRHFEIVADRKLNEEEIIDAMCLPDIDVKGSCEEEHGIKVTYIRTECGDDSQVDYYLETLKHTMEILPGGKKCQ